MDLFLFLPIFYNGKVMHLASDGECTVHFERFSYIKILVYQRPIVLVIVYKMSDVHSQNFCLSAAYYGVSNIFYSPLQFL